MEDEKNIRIHGINASESIEDDGEIIIKKLQSKSGLKITITFKKTTELERSDHLVNRDN